MKIPCRHNSVIWPEIDTLFSSFLKDSQKFLTQDIMSRLIVNQTEIPIYQNLSLGIDN